MRIPLESKTYKMVFFYIVRQAADGRIDVQRVAEEPDAPDEQKSLTLLQQGDAALLITWHPSKPAPNSDERTRALTAVIRDLLGAAASGLNFALGHVPPDAVRSVTFHTGEDE